jgi:hypothetical protein
MLSQTSLLDTRRGFLVVVALGLFAMAARDITDPDVWWHLRTGQLILQNHAVFHADPYSFTKFGQPWVNHEWLSDVLIFSLYRTGGWAALVVAFAAMTSAAFMLMLFRCAGRPYLAAVFTVWSAVASAPALGIRPQIFSLLLASVFLFLLERSYLRPSVLWYLPPIMLLWANLHAGFALGVLLIVAFLLGDVLDAAFGFQSWTRARLKQLGLVLAACLVVIPLNPYGAKMYWYPLQTVHSHAIQGYISEWASPNFHQEMYFPAIALILAIFFLAAISPRRLRPRDLLLLSITIWMALGAARHVPIFAIVAAPILSNLVYSAWWKDKGDAKQAAPAHSPRTVRPIFNGAVVAMLLVLCIIKIRNVVTNQSAVEGRLFPASAVAFLRQNRLPGPIFNSYDWGGYLIWRLYPEYRVYIDGRADVYDGSFMDQFGTAYQISKQSWPEALEYWQIRTVLVPSDAPIAAALRLRPGWMQVYQDSQAVLLEKTQP